MRRYLLLYTGITTPLSGLSSENLQAVIQSWNGWAQSIGEALADPGWAIAGGRELVDNGEVVETRQINGYSMVNAADMESALALAKNHPWLTGEDGRFGIMAFEIMSGSAPASGSSPQPIIGASEVPQQPQPAKPQTSEAALQPKQVIQPTTPQTPVSDGGELNISHDESSEGTQLPPVEPPQ